MLVYEEYFNAGVSIYISHTTIFTFAAERNAWPKALVSNVILAFLDHLKPKIFFVGQPWWPT